MEDRSKDGNGYLKSSIIVCRTNSGMELRGTLIRLNRFIVVFEIYNPSPFLRVSEVLGELKIIYYDRTIYSGQGVVRNIIDTGQLIICEATLQEKAWKNVACNPGAVNPASLKEGFAEFLKEAQQTYVVLPEFKLVVADMQSFLSDLRLWLEQWELNVRAMPTGDRSKTERDLVWGLVEPVGASLNYLFEKFETIGKKVPLDLQPAHSLYVQRQLHPYLLCSPFMHRIYEKPLGYAGDYEMVNMICRILRGRLAFFQSVELLVPFANAGGGAPEPHQILSWKN